MGVLTTSVPIRTLRHAALGRAMAADLPVYDTLFVELAARRRLPLVTFDAELLSAFPDVPSQPSALAPR